MKILVIGGTGLIGSIVVQKLRSRGHEAVSASPSTGVNSLTGEGLKEAMNGASVVVDVSGSRSFGPREVMEFFQTSTANLLKHGAAAGVRHHVVLSVVGTDRSPRNGYYEAKLAQEKLVEKSGIPYTIVRATQFFEFLETIASVNTQGKIVRMPSAFIQPIAADDVAEAVVEIALSNPRNGILDVAGPCAYPMDELMRIVVSNSEDSQRKVLTDEEATYFGSKLEPRSLVPLGEGFIGATRLEEWMGQRRAQLV